MASSSETTIQMSPIGSVQMKFPVPKGGQKYFPSEPEFEMVKLPDDTHEVVIAIEDTDASTYTVLSAPPKADRAKVKNFHKPLNRSPLSPLPKLVVADNQRPTTPPRQMPPPPPRSRPGSPRSTRSSPTLVRNGSISSTTTHSPVMRSMFPRYDPSVPLTHQKYYPNPESRPMMPEQTRNADNLSSYSPSLYSQMGHMSPNFKQDMCTPRTVAGSRPVSPFRASESLMHTPKLSSPEELLDLWSIANGQGSQEALDTYTLILSCDDLTSDHEIINLCSPSHPLYTLSAAASTLTITRTHPITSTQPTIPICVPQILTPTSTKPFVASIFPKLAELMALDQSSSAAIAHKLTRQASNDLQAEALTRAFQNEASSLLYDTDSGSYCLTHPTLSEEQTALTVPVSITPSTTSPSSISFLAPTTTSSNGTATTAEQKPLLSLHLPTLTLTLHTQPITALPSLYTLDTLLSALLTILLHLHRSSPSSENKLPSMAMPFFAPPPTTLSHPSLRVKGSKTKPSAFSGLFRSASTKTMTTPTLELGRFDRKSLGEMETEDHGTSAITFAPLIRLEDPKLSATQRTALKTLYWGFGIVIWIQGIFVNLLAAGVVGVGRMWEREREVQRGAIGA